MKIMINSIHFVTSVNILDLNNEINLQITEIFVDEVLTVLIML